MSRARNLAGFGSAVTNPQNPVNVRLGIVTAIEYYGDGSNLTGTPGGLGTSLLPDDLTSPLNKIYYTDANLTIGSTITVDPPASASAAYTQYTNIVLQGDADLIVGDGDDFIPDILGIGTDVDAPGILANGEGKVRVDNITDKSGVKAPKFPYGLAVSAGAAVSVGYSTEATPSLVGVDTTTGVFFPSAGQVAISIGGTETFRVNSSGYVGIGTDDPTYQLQVFNDTIPASLRLQYGGNTGFDVQQMIDGSAQVWNVDNTDLKFATNDQERLRVLSSGELLVSRTAGIGSTTQNIQVGQQILAPQGIIGSNGGWSRVPDRLVTRTNAGDGINNHTYKVDLNDLTDGVGTNGSVTLLVTFSMRRSNTTAAYSQKSQYMGLWNITRQETNLADVDANHIVTNNMTVDSVTTNNPDSNLDVTMTFDTTNVRGFTDHACHFITRENKYPGAT
jgi:hypothetical protein